MSKLSFENTDETLVKLEGKVVGIIKPVPYFVVVGGNKIPYVSNKTNLGTAYKMGYQYFPKGSKTGGKIFESKGECMYSLKE